VRCDFTGDLEQLQDILSDSSPAYVLARFDEPQAQEWLAISYVPDTAKVRDKMLYASSRSAITQSLGSGYFTESIFASTKAELTPEGYKAHQAHMAAPQPLSTREKELADLKHAERGAEGSVSGGTQSRKNHIGHTVGLVWDESLSDAVLALGQATTNQLVLGVRPARLCGILFNKSQGN
jgi:twinfilin-like protein